MSPGTLNPLSFSHAMMAPPAPSVTATGNWETLRLTARLTSGFVGHWARASVAQRRTGAKQATPMRAAQDKERRDMAHLRWERGKAIENASGKDVAMRYEQSGPTPGVPGILLLPNPMVKETRFGCDCRTSTRGAGACRHLCRTV